MNFYQIFKTKCKMSPSKYFFCFFCENLSEKLIKLKNICGRLLNRLETE